QPADRDLVPTLDHAGDPALHRDAGLRGDRQRVARLRPLPQPVRQANLVAYRDDRRLHVVADLDLELPLIVEELRAVDPRLALAPDLDEHLLIAAPDPAARPHLRPRDGASRLVLREQRGEIFFRFRLAHARSDYCAGRRAALLSQGMCAPCCVHWWRVLDRAATRRDFVKGVVT